MILRFTSTKKHSTRFSYQDSKCLEDIINEIDDAKLKQEVRSSQPFLVDCELQKARHKVFNYAVETLNETTVKEKLDLFFNQRKYAAKDNLAFAFFLKIIEVGAFRYFYPHKSNSLLDRLELVCTNDDLAKLKYNVHKADVIKSCSREKLSTKCRFYKFTNLSVLAAVLKDVPMGCKNAVLRKPLLKFGTINCLTYKEGTRQP